MTLTYLLQQVTPRVRDIAWKAQTRLTGRYRALSGRGNKTTVVCTAIARELVGFMWSSREFADLARRPLRGGCRGHSSADSASLSVVGELHLQLFTIVA